MSMSKVLTLAFAVLAASALAISAQAQQAQPDSAPTTSGSMMGHQGMGRGMGMRGGQGSICGMMTTHVEGRLAFLKAELAITSEQESLWNDYAAAVRDNAKSVASRCSAMMKQGEAKQSLPDRLEAQEQFVAARLDALRAVSKALKPLYGALSDTQKQLADELIRSSTGMM